MNPIRTGRPRSPHRARLAAALAAACAARGAATSRAPTRRRRAAPTAGRRRRAGRQGRRAEHADAGIAWRKAASDAEVDAAFATARSREQAGVRLLGREVVPAVQPGQGDALQPPGLHRALARLRAGLRRRRQPGRAEDRRALQGAAAIRRWCCSTPQGEEVTRLPGEVDAGPLHRGADARHERGAAGEARCSPTRSPAGDARRPTTGACSPSIRGTPTSSR